MTLTRLQTQANALKTWVSDIALPFWAEAGRDSRSGWYEHLNLDRSPDKLAIRRHRIHARQVYTYALAEKLGWYPGRVVAVETFQFMTHYGHVVDDKAGFIHLLKPDLTVQDDTRDLYDHAFYLFACASLFSIGEEKLAHKTLSAITDYINTSLTSEFGGWRESNLDKLPRRQNSHLHMFEAAMAWMDISDNSIWRNYADEVFSLFEKHFYDPEHQIVREFFNMDWSRVEGPKGETVEPGHGAEWVWLLRQYESRTGINTSRYADSLYEMVLKYPSKFLNDEEDIARNVRRDSKRLWCQTELIKAHLAQAEFGNNNAITRASKSVDGFYETYLTSDGVWVDQINSEGEPIAPTIPVSTFYHVICMITELCRVTDLLSEKVKA